MIDIINEESFEDGLGGIWWRNNNNGLWQLNCDNFHCSDCPYNSEFALCDITDLSKEEVEKRIIKAKNLINF